MLQHDSMFFIGVFIFIFLLWIVLGGPSRPLSFSGPLLNAPDALGGGTYLALPRAPNTTPTSLGKSQASGINNSNSNQNTGLTYQEKQVVKNALKVAAFGTPSPERGKVILSQHVSNAGASNPQNEYLELEVSSNAEAPVTISGWSISSEVSGKGALIPQGTETPRSGVINAAEPIVLYPGDRAIVSSGRSPIGASFRENVCIGYFAQFQKFSPSLTKSCPTPTSELTARYGANLNRDTACIDYVENLSRCSLALSPPPTLTSACQSFLTTYLNYNGCLNAHEHDYNFKRTTWRIYLGRTAPLWQTSRETVKLLDASGKTVDMFTY